MIATPIPSARIGNIVYYPGMETKHGRIKELVSVEGVIMMRKERSHTATLYPILPLENKQTK